MPKRRGPSERKRLDPDDVLAGRVRVSAAELLDLIHWVNPTGRELGAREDALRYAQKSRLQSLLVRRFGEELDVVPDPEREGTVSLLHRGQGRDGFACRHLPCLRLCSTDSRVIPLQLPTASPGVNMQ